MYYRNHSSPDQPNTLKAKDIPVIFKQLNDLPSAHRQQKLEELQRTYNLPFQLTNGSHSHSTQIYPKGKVGDCPIDKQDRSTLTITDGQGATLKVGPLIEKKRPTPLWMDSQIDLLIIWLFSSLLLFTIATCVYLRYHFRDLLKLNHTTSRLAGGELNARCDKLKSPLLNPLHDSINQMAGKIETMVQGWKAMTNAAAHELRTPLARLQFRNSMLSEEDDPQLRAELQEGIERNIKELQSMIDAVIQYGRISRCDIPLSREPTRLAEWIDKLVAQLWDLPDSLTLSVKCRSQSACLDRKLMFVALQNLLGNARKYARSRILLKILSFGEQTLFIIDDDGPGIPKKYWDNLFDPFYRLDRHQDFTKGGSGLGLSFVKMIAEHHRGQVSVTKSPLGGARFILSIASC